MKKIPFVMLISAVFLLLAVPDKSGIAGSIINNVRVDGVTEIETDGGKSNVGVVIIDGVTQSETGGGKRNAGVITGCVQGSGIRKTEQRKLPSFKALYLDGAFDVHIELQKKQSVEITGDDNILPHIITTSAGGLLRITTNESICTRHGLVVNISTDNIEEISSDGSNDIIISGVNNKSLTLHLDGSGDVQASGVTKKFFAGIDGSGNIHARELQAEEVGITISGAADAEVFASQKLVVEIDGAGDVSYYGNPEEVVKSVSGAGDIVKGN